MSGRAVVKREGYDPAALEIDRTGLEPCEGFIKKQSHRGYWQTRYFVLNNGYLNYYNGKEKKSVQASINLSMCKSVEAVDMYTGDFTITFTDDAEYHLKGTDGKTVSRWCDAITERIEWSKSPAARSGGGRRGGGGGRKSVVADDDDDDDGGRRRRRNNKQTEDDDEDGGGGGGRRSSSNNNNSNNTNNGSNRRNSMDDEKNQINNRNTNSNRQQPNNRNDRGTGDEDEDGDDDVRKSKNNRANGGAGLFKPGGGGAGGRKNSDALPAADSDEDENTGKNKSNNNMNTATSTNNKNNTNTTVDSDEDYGGGASSTNNNKSNSNIGGAGTGGVGLNRRIGSSSNSASNTNATPAVDSDDDDAGGGNSSRNNNNNNSKNNINRRRDSADDSSPVPPRAPPGPSMEGWVKKKAQTRLGRDLHRYLRLVDGVLFLAADQSTSDYGNAIDVSTITSVKCAGNARSTSASERKAFIISTSFQGDIIMRATDEAAANAWVSTLTAAMKHKKLYGRANRSGGGGGGRNNNNNNTTTGGGRSTNLSGRRNANDSDADSDADDDQENSLPPPPAWFRDYEKPDEARWMQATQKMLNRLFADIFQKPSEEGPGAEEGVTGDGDERKVVISKLAEASTRACAELEDRVMELRMRARPEVIKHMVQFFDLKFLNELTPLTTGTAPDKLSSKQLLQLIDCVEGFQTLRKRALGTTQLSAQEGRPGNMLRETKRTLLSRYMRVMGPKLHSVAERVLAQLKKEKGSLVHRTLATRLGTKSPTDLFNLMSEHLKVAKEGGSTNLQRRVLSAVMAEVVFYAREVLTELMDSWASDPAAVDMDYVIAVINDSGFMLDHLEQLEAYFAEALAAADGEATERSKSGKRLQLGNNTGGSSGAAANAEEDEMDKEEAEQAREDLAAIEQDIPRAKNQLLNSGCQLTGVLADVMTADFREPLTMLFTPAWEKGIHVTTITATVVDYLSESRVLLDPFFFDRLSSMILAHLVEQYMLRLISPESMRKDKKDKKFDFKGGFGSRFKLNEDRLKKLVSDVIEIGHCFSQFMPREDLLIIMAPLNTVRELLTFEDHDTCPLILEQAMRNSATTVSTHIYLALDKCLDLREDISKQQRKSLKEEGKRVLWDVGEPPQEDEDLLVSSSANGGGVMHGASMSQGIAWNPQQVTSAIYKSLFPNALKDSLALFQGWAPPVRSPAPLTRSASIPEDTSMSAFLGGGGGGGEGAEKGPASPAAVDMSSFLGGKSTPAANNNNSNDSDDDIGGGVGAGSGSASSKPSFMSTSSSNTRNNATGGDDDNARSNHNGGRNTNNKSRRGPYDDDDDDDGFAASSSRTNNKRSSSSSSSKNNRTYTEDDESPAAPSFTSNARGAGNGGGGGGADRRRRGRRAGRDDEDEDDFGGGGGRRR